GAELGRPPPRPLRDGAIPDPLLLDRDRQQPRALQRDRPSDRPHSARRRRRPALATRDLPPPGASWLAPREARGARPRLLAPGAELDRSRAAALAEAG